jgi:hypothetical protein
MTLGRSRRRFLGHRAPKLPAHLSAALEESAITKQTVRDALRGIAARPRFLVNKSPLSATSARLAATLSSDAPNPVPPPPDMARNPRCTVTYDANTKLTTMIGGAEIHRSMEDLAKLVDPRSWDRGGGVIAKVFPVCDVGGEYEPSTLLDDVPLGKPWNKGLLYEYARSEVSSYENILAIPAFTVERNDAKQIVKAHACYGLYECLTCVVGAFSSPGGLTVNTGYVEAIPLGDGWSRVEVMKEVKVRDFTPNDPGNRYDFGEWANDIIGSTLSLFVEDISLLSPFV